MVVECVTGPNSGSFACGGDGFPDRAYYGCGATGVSIFRIGVGCQTADATQ